MQCDPDRAGQRRRRRLHTEHLKQNTDTAQKAGHRKRPALFVQKGTGWRAQRRKTNGWKMNRPVQPSKTRNRSGTDLEQIPEQTRNRPGTDPRTDPEQYMRCPERKTFKRKLRQKKPFLHGKITEKSKRSKLKYRNKNRYRSETN